MATGARVESIEVLRRFRAALWKFAEAANLALGDAEGEVQRMVVWLETEQQTFWNHQVRSRTEAVTAAKEKVRSKKLFKDSSGRAQSAVDEEKALMVAQRRLEEAQQKLENTRKWARRLQRELHNYKGGVQPLATLVAVDIPTAVSTLDKLSGSLDKYVAAEPVTAGSTIEAAPAAAGGFGGEGDASMSRGDTPTGEPVAPAQPPAGFPQVAAPQAVLATAGPDGSPSFTVFATLEEAEQAAANRAAEAGAPVRLYDATGRVVKEIT